jgi:hypothetical protein
MPVRQLFPTWRDEQSKNVYPFADQAVPVTQDNLELPLGLVIDALVHPKGHSGDFSLGAIVIEGETLRFEILSANALAAIAEWSADLPSTDTVPIDDLDGDPAGVLIVDPEVVRQTILQWGPGEHFLVNQSGKFVPSTWAYVGTVPIEDELDGVPINNLDDVYVVARRGIRFECVRSTSGEALSFCQYFASSGLNANNEFCRYYGELPLPTIGPIPKVRVHAIGDPLAARRNCDSTFQTPRFIQSIVFQHGDQTIESTPGQDGGVFLTTVPAVDRRSLRISNQPGEIAIGFYADSSDLAQKEA